MTKEWIVRRATPEDAAGIVALEAASFGARSWGAASLRDSFSAARVEILTASRDEGGAFQGFAMWRDLGPEAEILTIGVEPSARRSGAATALLGSVIDNARKARVERLFLEVDAANEAALALYRAARFEPIGVRRKYYRDGADAAVMQLLL